MQTLIIVIHPDIKNSLINKRWIEALQQFPEKYVVHQLHQAYPNGVIDILEEQKLMEQYDQIVFQFPYYWFNSPWFLKKWLDEVLTHGWAYGSKSGYPLSGKKIALAISLGVTEEELSSSGIYKYPLAELTRPFELSFEYVKADYKPLFAYYGVDYHSSLESIEESVRLYLEFLDGL